jgi:hypothetical protein
MFTFRPRPATIQAPVVEPRLAPKMMPIPPIREISPALRNEIVTTETSELDCRRVVETTPKRSARGVERVAAPSSLSSLPPPSSRKPSSSMSMPRRKIATPPAISCRASTSQKARSSAPTVAAR